MTTQERAIIAVLEALDSVEPVSVEAIFGELHRLRFRGAITFHFDDGLPKAAAIGPPVRLKINARSDTILTGAAVPAQTTAG